MMINQFTAGEGQKAQTYKRFQKDFKKVKTIKLEQNYRSTKNILSSANAVIANNPERLGKKLWSENKEGEPLKIYRAFNERDEASFVVDIIKNWIDEGRSLNDVAICTDQMPNPVFWKIVFYGPSYPIEFMVASDSMKEWRLKMP